VAIVLVNAVGGLVAGALRGRPVAEAAGRAVLLAVGDGLASQVPALLTAVAAGVAVSRVASEEEGGRLGGELRRQLLAEPAALGAVAALLLGLAAAPGLPALPFLLPAAGAGALAWRGAGARRRTGGSLAPAAGSPAPTGLEVIAGEPPLILELADDLLALARADGERFLVEALPALRERLWRELGVPVPALAVRSAPLGDGEWILLVHEVPAARGRAERGERLALAPLDDLVLAGIGFAPEQDPLTGRPAGLVAAADEARAAALGPVRGPLERVAAACAWELGRHAPLLLGVEEAQALLDSLEPSAPALVREAARQLPPALLAEVLRRLLEEGVPIRPLRAVLEALVEAGGAARGAAVLTAAARRALRRHIGHRAALDGAPLAALILDPGAERAVRESLLGDLPALDPAHAARLVEAVAEALRGAGQAPVLLASGDVRRAVRHLLAPRYPRLQVLAYDELPPDQPVRPIGRVALHG
jgi:type III secretion protein V